MTPDGKGGDVPGDDREERGQELPEGEPEQPGGEPELPPPSTYAGRRGSQGAGEEGEESSGFTEDFDEVERDFGDELDDEFAHDESGDDAEEGEELEAEEDDDEPEGAEEEPEAQEKAAEAGEEPAVAGEQTVEAETVALGDREEAREAALAGLRARTAGKQAKRVPEPGAAAPRAPTPPVAAIGEATDAPEQEKPRGRAIWPRFLAASLVIVIAMATATSVNGIVYLDGWAKKLDDGLAEKLKGDLTEVEGGDPQTILILGSDERVNLPGDRRSDTAILLRIDPDRDAMSLLSIPRDLKVNIPNVGIDKFNSAYSIGGPKLTLRTVKALTGLKINHVVNINFLGFADAVNAIDCVYVDVDRRYFIPPESGIAEIDVEAGYQRLCGLKALQYVRYRHDDNDLVRAARQQDFLREARQKVPTSKLIEDRNELLEIFTDYTTSDINSGITLLELLKTFLGAASAQLNEVHFPAELGGPRSPYVTASEQAVQDAVEVFLSGGGTPGPQEPGEGSAKPQAAEGGGAKKGGKKAQKKEKPKPKPDGPAMLDASDTMRQRAEQLATETTKNGKPMLEFPVFYPTRVTADTTFNPLEASRAFPIDAAGDTFYRGYKFVLGFPGNAGFTEYYGVSGTSWENPPVLDDPSETRKIDGREYLLFYDGDRLRVVGWKRQKNSYWVHNSLLQTLEEDEMLSIATSMRQLGG